MKCIIIEDEEIGRIQLRSLLDDLDNITVLGEAGTCRDGLLLVREHPETELLLLDVELPDGTGFDLIGQLDNPPKVIFITNHEAYALRAFEINAVDYIQKPLTRARLESALERLESPVLPKQTKPTRLRPDDLVMLTCDNRKHFVKVSEIAAIESEQNYTHVLFAGGQHIMIKKTLATWEDQLPQSLFRRLGRSHIINTELIDRLEIRNEQHQLWLKRIDIPLNLSRSEIKKLQQLAKSV